LSVALGNRFHTRSNNLSEDKLVNICWSLLCCMLPCFMLPGTRGKAVRVCARASLDRFGTSGLFLVAALRSASRSLLTLSFSRKSSFDRSPAANWSVPLQAGCTGCAVPCPAAPNFGSPKTTRLSPAECALAQKWEGVGSHPLSLFSIGFPAI
jgi:hypothetical protein